MAIHQTRRARLGLLLSNDERRMLQELTQAAGLDMSDWIRQAIRQAHAQLKGSTQPQEVEQS